MRLRKSIATLHLPTRRELARTLAAGVLIAVICWYFGVDVWHAILLGCAITVTGLACNFASYALDAGELSWRPRLRGNAAGSRNDVARLSTALRANWGLVDHTAERRLQEIARRRLALEGLDLRSRAHRPAIEQRIGSRAYRALVRPSSGRLRLRTLMHCLDMLDAIDSTHYPVPTHGRRGDPLIPFSLGRARER